MSIRYDKGAEKAFKTNRHLEKSVKDACEKFYDAGVGDVETITGHYPPWLRLRVGGFRVIFGVSIAGEMVVRDVLPRGQAYAKKTTNSLPKTVREAAPEGE